MSARMPKERCSVDGWSTQESAALLHLFCGIVGGTSQRQSNVHRVNKRVQDKFVRLDDLFSLLPCSLVFMWIVSCTADGDPVFTMVTASFKVERSCMRHIRGTCTTVLSTCHQYWHISYAYIVLYLCLPISTLIFVVVCHTRYCTIVLHSSIIVFNYSRMSYT